MVRGRAPAHVLPTARMGWRSKSCVSFADGTETSQHRCGEHAQRWGASAAALAEHDERPVAPQPGRLRSAQRHVCTTTALLAQQQDALRSAVRVHPPTGTAALSCEPFRPVACDRTAFSYARCEPSAHFFLQHTPLLALGSFLSCSTRRSWHWGRGGAPHAVPWVLILFLHHTALLALGQGWGPACSALA